MKILMAGGTGFIGSALIPSLLAQHHQITALVRHPAKAQKQLPENIELINTLDYFQHFNQFDAIINLAGEPIFARRWTEIQKVRLESSRVSLTEKLAQLINRSDDPPQCFISGSATGYYGDCGEQIIDEHTPPAGNFAARLCRHWEAAALKANTRVCLVRTGIVLGTQGGALAQMLPLYRCGLGGKLGTGKQYWGWISLADMVRGILFLLENPDCRGAFNFVAPHAVRNAEFNALLGKTLRRPHFATVPAFILKLMLGERAGLLLDSQNLVPQHLLAQGFQFEYPDLGEFLAQEIP
ncbi:TIGR01777 family protein [Aggregatibacter actinomycetemcomitans]|uniref:TIGR01777 family oxidoreductase n=1 Tax=Aggregatibacter actinomycetemcomitans TaxID=714 RepID=UPI0011D5AF4F|nr:TIGR01777 family oxidoreductase [Aggregatibacter actinomycetemcomitans]QEH45781.1 TIGR01777 family protein [Aggregatibacter actinomycetemcomitans]QEH47460.1 TIGR01777 family protein [Aggregatibacter actinomycetemcomitans]QEH49288.1 TIGR01777 family protein [Aggregatibacter actinomycetemcomitans]TYA49931.1 TIGR01777 family protein [Aggregatibacter actinomycetemcomitans]TYA51504.1 TIGR01777 family protein [Aggregatibacter actinomycetemcomitans]